MRQATTSASCRTIDIRGKVILITGASSGIGEGIARELAPTGAKLFLGARRFDKLEALAREINDKGGTAVAMELDVTDHQSVKAFTEAARARIGRIDVLINNAGVMLLSPLGALKTDEWDRMIDANIKGVLWGIAAVLPAMTERVRARSSPSVRKALISLRRRPPFTAPPNMRSAGSGLERFPENVETLFWLGNATNQRLDGWSITVRFYASA